MLNQSSGCRWISTSLIMNYLGNKKILEEYKTAFLCSKSIPAEIILPAYDWAKDQRKQGNCIVCGNHSAIEKDVFEILLRGKQPLILMLARGMQTRFSKDIKEALDENRLLIISFFDEKITRVTTDTAKKRNQEMISMCSKIVVAYATPNGQLDSLLKNINYLSLDTF